MGNTLVKSNYDRNINDSLLGKEVKKILAEKEVVLDKDLRTGKLNTVKINKIRACCMGVLKENPSNNEFVTVNLPSALDSRDKYCKSKGKCIENSKLALQIKGKTDEICGNNYLPGSTGSCDMFIVNKCAKELYDAGCIITKKNKSGKSVRVWNSKNKNCFDNQGNLIYGNEECACINSATGFTLNNNPSSQIKGGIAFENKYQNPYGVDGTDNNKFTKYSLDIFGYEPQYQKPQVFDGRCAARLDSASYQAGEGKPYLLPGYQQRVNICMNQINVKDSNISAANFKNIRQNNNCGIQGKKALKVEENPEEREIRINKENEIKKRELERIEKEAEERRQREEAAKKEKTRLLAEKIKKEEESKRLLAEKIKNEKLAKKAKEEADKQKAEHEEKLEKEKKKSKVSKLIALKAIESEKEYKRKLSNKVNENDEMKRKIEEENDEMKRKIEEEHNEIIEEERKHLKNKNDKLELLQKKLEESNKNKIYIIGGFVVTLLVIIVIFLLLKK